MSNIDTYEREYRRQMTRASFQSLFWHVLLTRKREAGLTLKLLADKLGINKSYISRSFSSPPNWQVDKLSDMADALDVDLYIEARDRKTGRVYTPHGNTVLAITSTVHEPRRQVMPQTETKDSRHAYVSASA